MHLVIQLGFEVSILALQLSVLENSLTGAGRLALSSLAVQLQAPVLSLQLSNALLQGADCVEVGLWVRSLAQDACQLGKGPGSLLASPACRVHSQLANAVIAMLSLLKMKFLGPSLAQRSAQQTPVQPACQPCTQSGIGKRAWLWKAIGLPKILSKSERLACADTTVHYSSAL